MGVVRTFPGNLIRPMFEKICECIVDGGLLVVGQHEGEKVPGAVFQRRGGRLALVRDIMGSYQFKDLLLTLELPPPVKACDAQGS